MKNVIPKGFGMNILNGVAIGSVVVLIPGALLNELFTALLPVFPQGQFILTATALIMTMMCATIGLSISMMFKFTPIQSAAVAIATGLGSGVWTINEAGGFIVSGSGDIINMTITATIAVLLILFFGNRFKAYTMLLVPTLVLLIAGGLGVAILPYVQAFTGAVATAISYLLDLQPVLMSMLMAIIFSMMIVSPISTVGIALAINLSGLGSAAANVGICATAFGLAITGWKANEPGTSIALFLGSPKMAMPNVIKSPKIMLPVIVNAAISGVVCAFFQQQGTPMSAGFGISGLIGPVNAINLAGGWTLTNVMSATITFILVPIALAVLFKFFFVNMRKIVKLEDYRIDVS